MLDEQRVKIVADALYEAERTDRPRSRAAVEALDAYDQGQREAVKLTHGRHCACSACAAEDWTRPELGACGMHGPDCPREYAPLGTAGREAIGRWATVAIDVDTFEPRELGQAALEELDILRIPVERLFVRPSEPHPSEHFEADRAESKIALLRDLLRAITAVDEERGTGDLIEKGLLEPCGHGEHDLTDKARAAIRAAIGGVNG